MACRWPVVVNIVAAMEKDMAGGVLRHATGQPPSDTTPVVDQDPWDQDT